MFAKYSQGTVRRQAQTLWPEGTYEEHHGRDGFAGDCSQLYRRHPTTDWSRVEGQLRPRAIMTGDVPVADQHDPRAFPTLLLYNDDLRFSVSRRAIEMPYYLRNLDGDTLIVIQKGSGRLICDYGVLDYGPREYLVIPKGTNYKLVPSGLDNLSYVIETSSPIRIPDRTMFGHFLPFDIGVLDVPQLPPRDSTPTQQQEWEILLKRGDETSSIFYDFDPMDVEGWQGSVVPFRLKLADIRPLTAERLDVPPITHATFVTDGAWFCTFCPRPLQSAEDAVSVQPFHRNVDYDEVFVYVDSEDPGLELPVGLLTLTPAGMSHGPSSSAVDRPIARFPLYMLNVDTSRPLLYTPEFAKSEIPNFTERQRFTQRSNKR